MTSETVLGHRAVARTGAGVTATGDLDAAAGDAVWRNWATGR